MAAFLTEDSAERKAVKEREEHARRKAVLTKIELFNSLPEDVIDHLADGLRPAPFTAGEIMTRQGAEAHWLYLFVSGESEDAGLHRQWSAGRSGSPEGRQLLWGNVPAHRPAAQRNGGRPDLRRLLSARSRGRPRAADQAPGVRRKAGRRACPATRSPSRNTSSRIRKTNARRLDAAKSDLLARIRPVFRPSTMPPPIAATPFPPHKDDPILIGTSKAEPAWTPCGRCVTI